MSLIAISDLHIAGREDPLYGSLLSLLKTRVLPEDTLVFVGDIFDIFVGGKKIFLKRYSEFIDSLVRLSHRRVIIYYVEGNHDFLLKQAFSNIPHLTIHPQDLSIELHGKRFFFAHGDTVDQSDCLYLLLRSILRSPVMTTVLKQVPGKLLDQVGYVSSRLSRLRRPNLWLDLPEERKRYLQKIYRNYATQRILEGYDYVIMGHCHDLDEMRFVLEDRVGYYVNLGFPRIHGSFLIWRSSKQSNSEPLWREKLP